MKITKRQLGCITALLVLILVASIAITIWALFFRDSGGSPITPD